MTSQFYNDRYPSVWTAPLFAVQRLDDGRFLGATMRWSRQLVALTAEEISWCQGHREGVVVDLFGRMKFVPRVGDRMDVIADRRATLYKVKIVEVAKFLHDFVRPGHDLRRSDGWQSNPLAVDLPC